MCMFFFSSRRRHTRFDCDWSSDVCSSDLSGRKILPSRAKHTTDLCELHPVAQRNESTFACGSYRQQAEERERRSRPDRHSPATIPRSIISAPLVPEDCLLSLSVHVT